jgi:hypothetical protein
MIYRFFLSVFLLAVVSTSCGYTTGSLLPSQYRTLHVEPFTNRIEFVNENVRTLYVPLM